MSTLKLEFGITKKNLMKDLRIIIGIKGSLIFYGLFAYAEISYGSTWGGFHHGNMW
jgi:hypothetical protein